MVLKFKNSDGNWSFREGEVTYRFVPWVDVLREFVEEFEPQLSSSATREALGKMIADRDVDCDTFTSEREIAMSYIEKHFSEYDCATDIALSTENVPDYKSVLGVHFIEIWNCEKASAEYILLDTEIQAYLLSDSGKTIEKLN